MDNTAASQTEQGVVCLVMAGMLHLRENMKHAATTCLHVGLIRYDLSEKALRLCYSLLLAMLECAAVTLSAVVFKTDSAQERDWPCLELLSLGEILDAQFPRKHPVALSARTTVRKWWFQGFRRYHIPRACDVRPKE